MKKRYLSLVIIVTLALSLLASCAAPAPTAAPSPASSTAAPAPTTSAPAPKPTTAPTPTPTAKPAPEAKLPARMVFSSSDVGSYGYVVAVSLGNVLRTATGTSVRILPTGTGVSRLLTMKSGTADLGFLSIEGLAAAESTEEFNTIEWGPQKLFALLSPSYWGGVITQGDSGIKKVADIKGKRIAYIPGLPSVNLKTDGLLDFAGLTWKDVKRVDFPAYTPALVGLVEGKVDVVSSAGTSTTAAFQLEASPHGIYWIPLPFSNTEGWKRITAHYYQYSIMGQMLAPVGAGVKPGDKVEGFGYAYPEFVTYEGRMSDDVAYTFIKAFDGAYDQFKGTVATPEIFMLKSASKPVDIPFHPGVVRYLKEKGLWTPESEAINKGLLDRQVKLQAAWDTVLLEVAQKSMPQKEFPSYWLKRKAELVK